MIYRRLTTMSFQSNFTDIEYSNRRHRTKREDFLDAMDKMIPWGNWVEIIKPFYPDGKRGRKPVGIETMLRMYLMQNWFNLSDVGDAAIIQAPRSTKNKEKARDPEMHQTKKGNQ